MAKGILLSLVITGAFYALAKFLANTVTPALERAYWQEFGHGGNYPWFGRHYVAGLEMNSGIPSRASTWPA